VATNLHYKRRNRELRKRYLEEKMKTKLFALLMLAGSLSALAAGPRVFVRFGAGFGGYAAPAPMFYAPMPPAPVVAYVPPSAGPGYTWVAGYWYPSGPRYAWRAGYWAPRAYAGARWIAPHYAGRRYYGGYWRR
jgi:hypothetical protein